MLTDFLSSFWCVAAFRCNTFLPSFLGFGHDLDMYPGSLQLKKISFLSAVVVGFSVRSASLWLPWRSFCLGSSLPL